MPIAPKRPCPGKGPRRGGCGNLVSRGEVCCGECLPYHKQYVRRYDSARDESAERKFLHSPVWQHVRAMKLRRDPLCEFHKERGELIPAVLVHHKDRDVYNTSDGNLASLCTSCHETEHRKERWGRNG